MIARRTVQQIVEKNKQTTNKVSSLPLSSQERMGPSQPSLPASAKNNCAAGKDWVAKIMHNISLEREAVFNNTEGKQSKA